MALASRKSGAIHSKTGSDFANLKAKYDNNKQKENIFNPNFDEDYKEQLANIKNTNKSYLTRNKKNKNIMAIT